MKRVAIICHTNIKTDSRILRSIDSLTKRGEHRVTVFLPTINEGDDSNLPPNVLLCKYDLNGGWINQNILIGNQYKDILNRLDSFQFDIIICDNYPLLGIGIKLKEKNPSLTIIYDSREWYMETLNQFFPTSGWKAIYGIPLTTFNRWYHGRLEKKFAEKADHLVTVCQTIAEILSEKWGKPVHVLRNVLLKKHVDEQAINLSNFRLPFEEDDFILLYQGNLNPGRGLHILLKIASLLPSNYKTLILGNGMLKQELIAIKERENIDNVHFMNAVPYNDLLQITKQVDLGMSLIEPINESKRLSLPNKLFEYMSVGVPFMSTNLPEPKLLVEQYNSGILVDLEDLNGIVDKLKSLNKEELKDIGTNGRKAFESELNWDKEYDRLLEQMGI